MFFIRSKVAIEFDCVLTERHANELREIDIIVVKTLVDRAADSTRWTLVDRTAGERGGRFDEADEHFLASTSIHT